ncbi:MAG TPA: hypothetical protein VMA53_11495 [Stellaceae bacterium]|nr:hypothetical protein [Stellaceae bacterium]
MALRLPRGFAIAVAPNGATTDLLHAAAVPASPFRRHDPAIRQSGKSG